MTDRTSRAVAPMLAVCAAFAAQPSAYPPEVPKTDVAPPCGNVAKRQAQKRIACGRLAAEGEAASGKAGEKPGAFLRQSVHFCPQCGQF